MSRRRVLAIFRNDMREFRRNKQIISTMAVSPIGFLVFPVIFLFACWQAWRGRRRWCARTVMVVRLWWGRGPW